jgi:hypothetical protein
MTQPIEQVLSDEPNIIADANCLNMVRDYCRLAVQPTLSEHDAAQLNSILEQAETDGCLDFWISEADHFLDHELGLRGQDAAKLQQSEEQVVALHQKYLEYLKNRGSSSAVLEFLQELKDDFETGAHTIQAQLKEKGFDPGPIDGIPGPRTQAAIVHFQRAHDLDANGIPDDATQAALGI